MAANRSKFQLIVLSKYKIIKKIFFDGKNIKLSDTVKLLGITLDKNINFKWHRQNICRRANSKTKALFHYKEISKSWASASALPVAKWVITLMLKSITEHLGYIWYTNTTIWRTTRFK